MATLKYSYRTTLNVGNYIWIKFSQNNCWLWQTQMLRLIESQDLMGFIDEKIMLLDEMIVASDSSTTGEKMINNKDYISCRRSDRLLWGCIIDTLNEDTLSLVIGIDTTKDVCKALGKPVSFRNACKRQDSQERVRSWSRNSNSFERVYPLCLLI